MAFDQQRVGAGLRQRDRADVAAGVVEVTRTEHERAIGVDQAPCDVAAAAGGDVEVPLLAGRHGKLVGVGAVGRAERGADRAAVGDHGGGAQVQQPEAVGATDRRGGLDGERVAAGGQVEDAAAVVRITLTERPVGDDRPAVGAGQVPAQVVAVAAGAGEVLRGQRVEVDPLGVGQGEGPAVVLARRPQRVVDGRTQRQGRQHLGRARGDVDRDVVDVVVGAIAAVARTEGHAAVIRRHAVDVVVLDDRDFAATIGREVDRDIAAARGGRHHDAGVVELPVVQAEAGYVERSQPAAVEVQRHVVVVRIGAAVVEGVETDTEAAGQVDLLTELRRRAAGAPDVAVEPSKADAVALVADLGDAQVELGAHRARVDAR